MSGELSRENAAHGGCPIKPWISFMTSRQACAAHGDVPASRFVALHRSSFFLKNVHKNHTINKSAARLPSQLKALVSRARHVIQSQKWGTSFLVLEMPSSLSMREIRSIGFPQQQKTAFILSKRNTCPIARIFLIFACHTDACRFRPNPSWRRQWRGLYVVRAFSPSGCRERFL